MSPCDLTPWNHLRVNKTSHREQGRGVRAEPKAGTVHTFPADTADFREQFRNESSCDVLFLIEHSEHRRLLFVELKGNDFLKALQQLETTLLAVRQKLPRECRDSTVFEAVVAVGKAPPSRDELKAQNAFQQRTKVPLRRMTVQRGTSGVLK